MTQPYLSLVIRTCWSRRALLDNVIRLLLSYADRVPSFEIILALDERERGKWQIQGQLGNHVKRVFTAAIPGEPTWKYLHRKCLDAFAVATGTWIVVMDDDDWFSSERLRRLGLAMPATDVISNRQVYVHELRSARRGTYRRTMHLPGLLESTLSFRRELLTQHPITEPELGLWVERLRASGRHHAFSDVDHVMFLHGQNADLAPGRDGFKVGDDGLVFDGPSEYHAIGSRGAITQVIGETELLAWERAVR